MGSALLERAPSASARTVTVELPALHSAQIRVVTESKRFNVLECGRRFGKTTVGIDRSSEAALDGLPVGWFAPTYKLLMDAWRELVQTLKPAAVEISQQEKRITLETGGVIECWSLDTPDAGRSRKYAVAVIDEAGIVRDLRSSWQEAIRPTLTDMRGSAWFLGTPKGRNYFHQLFTKGQTGEPGWMSWRFGTADNPHIPADEIEAARRELPDDVFRQEYLGEPSDDAGNPFGIGAIRAIIGPLSPAPPAVWGWDLAKSHDWTVGIALDKSANVCRFERFQRPWGDTEAAILTATGSTPALVDSTGVGDPILERLQSGRQNFEGFKFTAPSKQQLMEGLALHIQQRRGTVPDGPIVAEAEAFEYEYTRTGVRYSAPQGMHDDCVCAWALAVAKLGRPQLAPRAWTV